MINKHVKFISSAAFNFERNKNNGRLLRYYLRRHNCIIEQENILEKSLKLAPSQKIKNQITDLPQLNKRMCLSIFTEFFTKQSFFFTILVSLN